MSFVPARAMPSIHNYELIAKGRMKTFEQAAIQIRGNYTDSA